MRIVFKLAFVIAAVWIGAWAFGRFVDEPAEAFVVAASRTGNPSLVRLAETQRADAASLRLGAFVGTGLLVAVLFVPEIARLSKGTVAREEVQRVE